MYALTPFFMWTLNSNLQSNYLELLKWWGNNILLDSHGYKNMFQRQKSFSYFLSSRMVALEVLIVGIVFLLNIVQHLASRLPGGKYFLF